MLTADDGDAATIIGFEPLTLQGPQPPIGEDVRLALNSVASTIVRAKRAEDVLRGQRLSDDLLREAGEIAATEVDPMDDNRGSADYKRDLVKVLVRRAAEQAIQRLS